MTALPDKPSQLLRLAVKDAQLCQQDPNYRLDMGTWHSPVGSLCFVCMAGAVMAKTLKLPGDISARPSWSKEDKLHVINAMREGFLFVGPIPEHLRDVHREFNSIVAEGWCEDLARADWGTYLKAADYLEGEGL